MCELLAEGARQSGRQQAWLLDPGIFRDDAKSNFPAKPAFQHVLCMIIKTIGILANAGKEAALGAARIADTYLRERGITTLLPHHIARTFGAEDRGVSEAEAGSADVVIVLGGDGTILAASRECAPNGTPILPVHLGRFGFLTEVAPELFTEALDRLLAGDYKIEERMMIAGVSEQEQSGESTSVYALNEIAVAHGPLSRVLHLRLLVNGRYVTTYAADGIIIATPTGSTAYSLSAGGPLVHPDLQTLLVTPICPHTLTARTLLVPPDHEVSVMVERDPEDTVRVTVDGQLGFPLQPGDKIKVRRSPYPARLITVGGADFYDKLQTKLRWGERVIY